jgi:hypothetical protein
VATMESTPEATSEPTMEETPIVIVEPTVIGMPSTGQADWTLPIVALLVGMSLLTVGWAARRRTLPGGSK